MTSADLDVLRRAIVIAVSAPEHGNHPFGVFAGYMLYASTEPCAMCLGAIHRSGIRRRVHALPETAMCALTPDDSDSPTLALPSREVFARGRHPVDVDGPQLQDEALAMHAGSWS